MGTDLKRLASRLDTLLSRAANVSGTEVFEAAKKILAAVPETPETTEIGGWSVSCASLPSGDRSVICSRGESPVAELTGLRSGGTWQRISLTLGVKSWTVLQTADGEAWLDSDHAEVGGPAARAGARRLEKAVVSMLEPVETSGRPPEDSPERCISCEQELRRTAAYCDQCGIRQAPTCAHCGHECRANAKHCAQCGQRLGRTGR